MTLNLFSLVLASATGWAVLALGYLPVGVLRLKTRQPLILAGAWAVVAATAPSAVFHWYLIFALIALMAWTRLDRPAGKVWLAIAGSLGLSLGIVFPLEAGIATQNITVIGPGSILIENPLALTSLYLGGAATGLAYVVFVVVTSTPDGSRRPPALPRALLIVTVVWTVFLFAAMRRVAVYPGALDFGNESFLTATAWTPLPPAIWLTVLSVFVLARSRRRANEARWLAGIAALLALITGLLAQAVLR